MTMAINNSPLTRCSRLRGGRSGLVRFFLPTPSVVLVLLVLLSIGASSSSSSSSIHWLVDAAAAAAAASLPEAAAAASSVRQSTPASAPPAPATEAPLQQQEEAKDTPPPPSSTKAEQLLLLQQQRQQAQQEQRTSLFVCLLAASAGWGDVRAHRTYGCFVNMCTGNTIRGTMALVESFGRGSASASGTPGKWHKAILPCTVVAGYCAGVALARLTKHAVENNDTIINNNHQMKQDVATETNSSSESLFQKYITLPLVAKTLEIQSHKNTCLAIVPLLTVLFVTADLLLHYFYDSSRSDSGWLTLSALPQAVACGLMHETASQATGGTILFAVTGHWASVARISAEQWLPSQSNSNQQQQQQQQQLLVSKLNRHRSMVASFIAGVALSVLFLDVVVPRMPFALPFYPVYTLTGIAFALLFQWYGTSLLQSLEVD